MSQVATSSRSFDWGYPLNCETDSLEFWIYWIKDLMETFEKTWICCLNIVNCRQIDWDFRHFLYIWYNQKCDGIDIYAHSIFFIGNVHLCLKSLFSLSLSLPFSLSIHTSLSLFSLSLSLSLNPSLSISYIRTTHHFLQYFYVTW